MIDNTIKRFILDVNNSLLTTEDLLKKYKISSKRALYDLLATEIMQEEIKRQNKPLSKQEENNLFLLEKELNKIIGLK